MLRLQRPLVFFVSSLTLGAIASALPLAAGGPSKGDPSKKEKVACACEACGLYAADLDALCERLVAGAAPKQFCEGMCPVQVARLQAHPSMYFAGVLQARPSDLEAMLEKVQARFVAASATKEQRARLLDFAASFPVKSNAKVTAELYKVAPAAFSTDHLIALADTGPEALAASLESRARRNVSAAAWCALRGKPAGRDTLLAALKKFDPSKDLAAETALAALGLAALGEPAALERILPSLRNRALAELDAGHLDRARTLVLQAHYISKQAKAGAQAHVAWLAEHMQWHCEDMAEKLGSADEIFQSLEEIQA